MTDYKTDVLERETKLTSNRADKGEKRGLLRACRDPKGGGGRYKQVREEADAHEDQSPWDQRAWDSARKRQWRLRRKTLQGQK